MRTGRGIAVVSLDDVPFHGESVNLRSYQRKLEAPRLNLSDAHTTRSYGSVHRVNPAPFPSLPVLPPLVVHFGCLQL